MKILKIFLLSAALFISFILQNCKAPTSENIQSKVETDITPQSAETPIEQENKIQLPTTGKVEFKGVSFTYNSQMFEKVEVEEVSEQPLEEETDKPNENFPKHLEFYFSQTDSTNHSIEKGRIAVVPMENYRQMFAVSNHMTKAFDENLMNLEKLLADKNFRENGQIPFMPFYDAEQEFIAKVEHIPFQNGKSLCFLTQYVQENTLINNENIDYYCQGFTNDRRNYVLAVFPVSISFLPKNEYVDEFEGYKIPETIWNKNDEKRYKNYISKITKRLDDLDSDKFEPSLNSFKKIINSLKIEK